MLSVQCAYVLHHNTVAPMGRVFMKLGMNIMPLAATPVGAFQMACLTLSASNPL
jgi:hypothetical protein